ncbi:hypothetical protein [Agriterribacter sp.]|uniref:phosphotriesterase family protein n=1 Tax=Agriterribacter sp. TaxID=2821509 RepID=UPI002D04733D|nr:hypothetical protein [Agriterribacter sp.]HRP54621.1 hypothetical protein [Agriterribacter sp.]
MHRKDFIRSGFLLCTPYVLPLRGIMRTSAGDEDYIMTVNGHIPAARAGFTLTHEHILVDFIGADKITTSRYNADEVYNKALPVLQEAVENGCKTLVECTPNYLGRNTALLQRLSKASGLHIISNTGYYGAAKEKFLPKHAYTDSAKQLAARWINEWETGIEGTGIKPGFIKTGVDAFPLSPVQQKLIEAAALTHLSTGLTFGVHTGNGEAALEELKIIKAMRVRPEAWVWIHAQSERNRQVHVQVAKEGGWVSFDGLNDGSVQQYIQFLKDMKAEKLLHRTLISHDAGWYHVGEPGGGRFRSFNTVFKLMLPLLRKEGFNEGEIQQVFIVNPAKALTVKVRRA